MAFYCEYDLPDPPHRHAAARVGYFDKAISAIALLKALPGSDIPENFQVDPTSRVCHRYLIPGGSPPERKARADEIAAQTGAVTEWCHGYYMARVGSARIYFYPPIFLADIEDGEAEGAA